MVTSCFLSKQSSSYVQNRAGDADQCVVDAVFLERIQRNTFQRRLCVFQQKLPKRVVDSMLTQLNKLKLKDNTGIYFLKNFVPIAQVACLL